jgi:hypothetical protein
MMPQISERVALPGLFVFYWPNRFWASMRICGMSRQIFDIHCPKNYSLLASLTPPPPASGARTPETPQPGFSQSPGLLSSGPGSCLPGVLIVADQPYND